MSQDYRAFTFQRRSLDTEDTGTEQVPKEFMLPGDTQIMGFVKACRCACNFINIID